MIQMTKPDIQLDYTKLYSTQSANSIFDIFQNTGTVDTLDMDLNIFSVTPVLQAVHYSRCTDPNKWTFENTHQSCRKWIYDFHVDQNLNLMNFNPPIITNESSSNI